MITARCHPLLEPLLPKPVPAGRALPSWLRDMPGKAASPTLGGLDVRTLKHCSPLIDSLSLGILIPLATDLTVEGGHLAWDWDPPIIPDAPITRAPVGIHVPEQATGAPIDAQGRFVIKFTNYWTLSVPAGWSLLFTHPLNRTDLPFHTLSGVVDCDGFSEGYVHFPALLRDGFEGTIARGTPVAQAIPVRREQAELTIDVLSDEAIRTSRTIQETLAADPGLYRKRFRR